jgi:CDK-activating kinase assembly factor MAT1
MSRTTKVPSDNPSDDICPVCKSNRYLNPSLEFLINPECYHKMCSTCVDRIFTSGPASCPVPHCGKTLRKKGFHKAFFADLRIEREVDVRKRVGAVYNRRQDDFETLLDWNNYLEDIEGLVFDIVEGDLKTRQKAEEILRKHREEYRGEIEENRKVVQEEVEIERLRERAEKDAARERRLAALREQSEEKAILEQTKRDVVNQLATTDGDATKIAMQGQKVILKKTSARRNLPFTSKGENSGAIGEGLTIRGLKRKQSPIIEKPYDPFGGLDLSPTRFVVQREYESEWLGNAKTDLRHTAGGYSLQEYYSRTMFEAFSGLAVFLEDEVADRMAFPDAGRIVLSQASSEKGKTQHKIELDDVF